jgi:hypothetical protein
MADESNKKLNQQKELLRDILDIQRDYSSEVRNLAKAIGDNTAQINAQAKAFRDTASVSRDLNRDYEELISGERSREEILKTINRQKTIEKNFLVEAGQFLRKQRVAEEDIAKVLSGELDIYKAIENNNVELTEASFALLELYGGQLETLKDQDGIVDSINEKSKEIANNFGVKGFEGAQKFIESIPGLKAFSEPFKEASKAARTAAANGKSGVKALGAGFKALGPALKSAFKPLIGLEILMALGQADKELVEIQRNLALSKGEARAFRAELSEAAAASGNINVTTTALLKTFNAINKELGFQGKFNSQNLVTATRLLDVVGLTEQSTANLTAAAEIRGNLLEDEYKTILATSYELQRQTGVQFSNKEILEAVGKVTGQVRANLGANPSAIAAAVTQAKLFGAELDDIVGASKALLDFESSIRNELEAELLLGRNLSLERARLAALTGDQSTLAAELSKNAQDFGTFTKLNVIQQDALASALGLQSDQLADILFKQEVQGKTAKELRALGKNELADRLEAQTLQDKFTKSVEKLKSVLVDVVSAFTPILDILGGALELVGKIIQGINSISPALSGALVGAGTGALIGGAPGAIIGGAIGLAGGVINTSTASTTLSSPSVNIGSNQDALKKEVQGMRMAFEKYAEKGTELKVSATNFNNKQKVYAYSV